MLVIADHAGGRVPVMDVESRYRLCMLLIADHPGGRVPVMDVKYRYRVFMLLIADHTGGRVPLMDVEERSRVCMLVIADHSGGKVPLKFALSLKSKLRRLSLNSGVFTSVGRASADSPKLLITSPTTASPSQSHFTPGHVQGSDSPHHASRSFHWSPPSEFFRAHSSVRTAGLRAVISGGPPRWSDTETAPENPLMRPETSLSNFKSNTS
jgi:hypothetical protein